MSTWEALGVIFLVAAVTLATRALPFLLFPGQKKAACFYFVPGQISAPRHDCTAGGLLPQGRRFHGFSLCPAGASFRCGGGRPALMEKEHHAQHRRGHDPVHGARSICLSRLTGLCVCFQHFLRQRNIFIGIVAQVFQLFGGKAALNFCRVAQDQGTVRHGWFCASPARLPQPGSFCQ